MSDLCTCYFSGYDIVTCNKNGKLEAQETAQTILKCTGITDDSMFWDFASPLGYGISIATCTWSTWSTSRCDQPVDSDYAVTRELYGTSVLTVKGNHRKKIAGAVRCGGLIDNRITSAASCDVRTVCKYNKRD